MLFPFVDRFSGSLYNLRNNANKPDVPFLYIPCQNFDQLLQLGGASPDQRLHRADRLEVVPRRPQGHPLDLQHDEPVQAPPRTKRNLVI